jgi:hypothetical protein
MAGVGADRQADQSGEAEEETHCSLLGGSGNTGYLQARPGRAGWGQVGHKEADLGACVRPCGCCGPGDGITSLPTLR